MGRTGAIYHNNGDAARQLNGTLEVVDEAMVNVYDGCVLNVNATVYGVGKLVKRGYGRLNLNADANSSWSGGVDIENGTVRVTKAAQLGTGEVYLAQGGVLVFENDTDVTVTAKVSGFGKIEFRGAGKVTFANAKAFVGSQASSDGALMAADATADTTLVYSGILSGSGTSLVKEGAGTQILAATNAYGGATTVADGTLKLGTTAEAAYAETLIATSFCHLDASEAGTVVEKDGTATHEVRSWKDVLGRVTFTQADEASHADWEFPVARDASEGMDGKPTVFFTGYKNRLQETAISALTYRTLILAHRVPSGSHPKGWSCAGVVGNPGSDSGIRVTGGNNSVRWLTEHGYYFVNGTEASALPCDTPLVSSVETPDGFSLGKAVIGDYWGQASNNRCYWGDIGEMLFFSESLSASDRRTVERALMEKWGVATRASVTNNVLPETTALEIRSGATLDLSGCDQTVRELTGWGSLVNTGSRTSILTVTSRYAFHGAIPANVKLVLDPAGTAIGALSFDGDPSAIAEFRCDYGGATADRIDVAGSVDLAKVALVLRKRSNFTGQRVDIATGTAVTGAFATAEGLEPKIRLRYVETAAQLSMRVGTAVMIR